MSDKRTSKQMRNTERPLYGRADFRRFGRMTDEEIMRTSPPELAYFPPDFWENGEMVPPILKEPISIRVDADVLSWFRSQGPRYQTRISAVLRAYVKAMKNRSRSKRPSKR